MAWFLQILGGKEHEIYGQLMVDLGYKKIYCANPVTLLAQAKIWKKQRAFRQHRAESIANVLDSLVTGIR